MNFPQTLTKKAITKYRSLHRSGKLSRGSDRGITLAYALWLANGRLGSLRAGLEIIGKTRDKQPKARFLQMVYQDQNGVTWDQHGRNAAARCEKAAHSKANPNKGSKRASRPTQQVCLPFSGEEATDQLVHWEDIHPANLEWFATQWGQDGIRTGDAMRMMEVVMRFEGMPVQQSNPRQMGLIYPDEGQPERDLAPLNSNWYAQLAPPKPRARRPAIARSDT